MRAPDHLIIADGLDPRITHVYARLPKAPDPAIELRVRQALDELPPTMLQGDERASVLIGSLKRQGVEIVRERP